MKNNLYILLLTVLVMACVDDFQDANPPRLLDAPAVFEVSSSKTLLSGGESTTITISVSDAPAGVDSVAVEDTDDLGIAVGGTTVLVSGQGSTKGEVIAEYTAPMGFSGAVNLAVSVFDAQVDDKGDDAKKSSVAQDIEVSIVCGSLSGAYAVVGTILVDDFGSGPYNYTDNLSLEKCETENSYAISDISGGLYTNSYADNYGTSARNAVIVVDANTNEVTWANVSDQFGGQIIQDPAQPMSVYDPASNKFTIYWTATRWGERGVTEMTK